MQSDVVHLSIDDGYSNVENPCFNRVTFVAAHCGIASMQEKQRRRCGCRYSPFKVFLRIGSFRASG
jgi:hypothetical protein